MENTAIHPVTMPNNCYNQTDLSSCYTYNYSQFSNMDILKRAIEIVELDKKDNFTFEQVKKVYEELKKLLYEN